MVRYTKVANRSNKSDQGLAERLQAPDGQPGSLRTSTESVLNDAQPSSAHASLVAQHPASVLSQHRRKKGANTTKYENWKSMQASSKRRPLPPLGDCEEKRAATAATAAPAPAAQTTLISIFVQDLSSGRTTCVSAEHLCKQPLWQVAATALSQLGEGVPQIGGKNSIPLLHNGRELSPCQRSCSLETLGIRPLQTLYIGAAALEGGSEKGSFVDGCSEKGSFVNRSFVEGGSEKGSFVDGCSEKGSFVNRSFVEGGSEKGSFVNGCSEKGSFVNGCSEKGGSKKRVRAPLIHQTAETDHDDDFKRASDEPIDVDFLPSDFEWTRDSLDQKSATQIAKWFKANKAQALSPDGKLFSLPRKLWDKMLECDEILTDDDKLHIRLVTQGKTSIPSILQNSLCPRQVELPKFEIVDAMGRVRGGKGEYVILTITRQKICVNQLSLRANLQSNTLEEVDQYQAKATLWVKSQTSQLCEQRIEGANEVGLPINTNQLHNEEQTLVYPDYLLNGKAGKIFFFAQGLQDSDEIAVHFLPISKSEISSHPIPKNTILYEHLKRRRIQQTSQDQGKLEHKIMESGFCAPQLVERSEGLDLIAFSQCDEQFTFKVFLFNVELGQEVLRVDGAQALMYVIPSTTMSDHANLTFLADPYVNTYKGQCNEKINAKRAGKYMIFSQKTRGTVKQVLPQVRKNVQVDLGNTQMQVIDLRIDLESKSGQNFIETFDFDSNPDWQDLQLSIFDHENMGVKVFTFKKGSEHGLAWVNRSSQTVFAVDHATGMIQQVDKQRMVFDSQIIAQADQELNRYIALRKDGMIEIGNFWGDTRQELTSVHENDHFVQQRKSLRIAATESADGNITALWKLFNEYCMMKVQDQSARPTKIVKPNQLWSLQSVGPIIAYTSMWAPNEVFFVHTTKVRKISEALTSCAIVKVDMTFPIFTIASKNVFHLHARGFFTMLLDVGGSCVREAFLTFLEPFVASAFLKKDKIDLLVSRPTKRQNRMAPVIETQHVTTLLSGADFSYIVQSGKTIARIHRGGIELIQPDEGHERADVQPIVSDFRGEIYLFLVEKQLESQTDHIVFHKFEPTQLEITGKSKGFTMQESDVLGIQMCTDYTENLDPAEMINGQIYSGMNSSLMRMWVLDKAGNFITLHQKEEQTENFEVESVAKLDHVPDLVQEIQQYGIKNGVILGDRMILLGTRAFNIEGGLQHDTKLNMSSDSQCQKVANSAAIAIWSKATGKHTILNDFGRRTSLFSSVQLWRELNSAHQLAENLLLLQLKRPRQNELEHFPEGTAHWSLMETVFCNLQGLPTELRDPLMSREWSAAQSCIVDGGLTQLVLCHKQEVVVLKINAGGKLLRKQTYLVQMDALVLQNVHGHLLQVILTRDGEDFAYEGPQQSQTRSETQLPLVKIGNLGNEVHSDLEICYLGDFLCLKKGQRELSVIKAYQVRNGLPIKDLNGKQIQAELKIPLSLTHISLNACNPMNVLRLKPLDFINSADFARLANCFQVTNPYRYVYQLSLNDKGELECFDMNQGGSVDDLEPNKFVETGMQMCQLELNPFQENPERAMQSSPFGNLVFSTQRTVCRRKKPSPQAIMFRPIQGIYRKYAFCDVAESTALKLQESKHADIYAMIAQFRKDNVFTILGEGIQEIEFVSQKIIQRVEEGYFDEKDICNLSLKICEKQFIYDADKDTVRSVSLLTPGQLSATVRDALIKICRLNPNFSYMTEFSSQRSFAEARRNLTAPLIEEFHHCFVETHSSKDVKVINWPRDLPFFVHSQDSSQISEKKYEELFGDYDNKTLTTVNCRMLDLSWFFQDRGNFVGFSTMIQKLPNKVITSEFIECLLDKFWAPVRSYICLRLMTPHLLYTASSLTFMKIALDAQALDGKSSYWGLILVLPQWAYQFYLEVRAMMQERLEYFKRGWNYIDLAGLFSVLLAILIGSLSTDLVSVKILRDFAAFGSFFSLLKILDWLRLFEETAFYVLLVTETLDDIKYFLLVLFTTLMMFGAPLLMLSDSSADLVDKTFNFWLADLLFNQYLLALGEFSTLDNFAENQQGNLALIFFIGATFISQLTILNMLIAVMGDTYERIIENKEVNATMSKLTILDDLNAVLPQQGSIASDKEVYLFLVKPNEELDDEGDSWEGSLKRIIRVVERKSRAIEQRLDKKTDALQASIEDMSKKEIVGNRLMRAHIDQSVRGQSEKVRNDVKERISKMESRIDDVLVAINELRR